MATWTVVEFKESQTVEAVPTSWLIGQQCYWPPVARDKLILEIKRNLFPNTSWPLYDVRIFKDATFDSYLVARSKAKKAEDTSDLNSDYEKRKTIPTRKIVSSSESEAEETVLPAPPKLQYAKRSVATPAISNKLPIESDVGALVDEDRSQKNPIYNSDKALPDPENYQQSCQCCLKHQKKIETFLSEILKKQGLIRAQMSQIQEDVANLSLSNKNERETTKNSILKKFNFPIDRDDDVTLIEDYLKEDDNFGAAIDDLKKIGGKDVYDFVRRCLSTIVTNKLASYYSFHGQKNKIAFKNLKLSELLVEAAIQYTGADKRGVEEAIQKWLRRAKERDASKKNKI